MTTPCSFLCPHAISELPQARFKYPPHWVPLTMLYEAMSAVDPTTGQPRGYLRLSANHRPDSVLFTLDIRPDGSWREAETFIQSTAPQLVQVGITGSSHGRVSASISIALPIKQGWRQKT